MDVKKESLELHEKLKGKLSVDSKVKIENSVDLSLAYTPGVAEPCLKISEDIENVYKYTMKGNTVAVVTDGTAVLGLGDIGPEAAMPVMEGKCVLFKEFAGVDAFPICINSKNPDEIVRTVELISPGFGGVNLEDISAPRCFEIEERLKKSLNIPVFHDDQHGTAIVVLAGLINAIKLLGKKKENLKIVVNGAGSAGIAITTLLLEFGVGNVIMCDKKGIISENCDWLNSAQRKLSSVTNKGKINGSLSDAMKDSDVFIGVSAPGTVSSEMVRTMHEDAVVFAMANPVPEIFPEEAKKGGARIIGTGRSDFPNQVNNVLAFPGIFKGALKCRKQITQKMKLAAAFAIAGMIDEKELNEENILPKPFEKGISEKVAQSVIEAAE